VGVLVSSGPGLTQESPGSQMLTAGLSN
jgi:hypothetical protein